MTAFDTTALAREHRRQVADWPLARTNYAALERVETKEVAAGSALWRVQFNPARAVSASANTDRRAIAERPCFLCAANRPVEQRVLAAERGYEVLVNPFPVFPLHFTIASGRHEPQLLATEGWGRVADMMAFARMMPGMVVFYNGPRCGASAPDHLHFQAVPAEMLPMFGSRHPWPLRNSRFVAAGDAEAAEAMERVCSSEGWVPGGEEPMMNVYAMAVEGGVELTVIPRRAHRPSCYGTGEGQMLASPAAVECAGVMITPRRADFNRMDALKLKEILREVGYADL